MNKDDLKYDDDELSSEFLTSLSNILYDYKDDLVYHNTSADILDYGSLALSAGYSTSSAVVASLDYDIGGLSKLGITSPLLSILDLRVGMFVGLSDISTATSGGTAD